MLRLGKTRQADSFAEFCLTAPSMVCAEQAKKWTIWGRQGLLGSSTPPLQEENKMEDKWILSNCCEIPASLLGYLGRAWPLARNHHNKSHSLEWFGSSLKRTTYMWKEVFLSGLIGNNSSMSFFHDVSLEIFPHSLIEGFAVESS